MSEKYRLKVRTHFDAAHKLEHYAGKCQRMHGHRWDVEVELVGSSLDECNIMADFSAVKKMLTNVLADFDHYVLNDVCKQPDVSAEYLAKVIYIKIRDRLLINGEPYLSSVTVWESPECSVTYEGDYEY